jgi:hypothetical protein
LTVTVPVTGGARFLQDLVYGSERWHSTYALLRSINEGMNGYLKDGAFEALDDPERRRVRGVAAQSLFVAFLVFSANLRRIRAFKAMHAAIKSGKVAVLRRRRRRRSPSIKEWLPAASAVDPRSQSPPQANPP